MPDPPLRPLVLVIDDEPDILESLQGLIEESLGYTVLVVPSATQALEVLAILPGNDPDLLIVDHQMPGMTGIDLLEQVRLQRAWVPAILCTAYADAALLRQAVERASIASLVAKPVDPESFVRLVGALVTAHRAGRRVLAPSGLPESQADEAGGTA